HQHSLDLYPSPGIGQLLQLQPVLSYKRRKHSQRIDIILLFQALLSQFLRRPAERPFQDIHDILKMIIKSLPGNVAFSDQLRDRDLIYVLFFQQLGESFGNQCFHVFLHRNTSLMLMVLSDPENNTTSRRLFCKPKKLCWQVTSDSPAEFISEDSAQEISYSSTPSV